MFDSHMLRRAHTMPVPCHDHAVVIRSIPVRKTVGLAVRIFPATTRNFTKDTVLSENGRGAAWYVGISLKVLKSLHIFPFNFLLTPALNAVQKI
jgi:hypothetical protein